MGDLRVRVIGGLAVDGRDQRQLGSRKARTLLAMLAAAGGAPVSTDRLAEGLWPGDVPARPVEQVQVLVSRLRSALGADRVRRTDAGYSLRFDWLDLDELETRTQEAATRLAAGSPASARGAALAAIALDRGPAFGETEGAWVDLARSRVERTLARARALAAEAALALGDPADAAALAQAALDHDPFDEASLRTLMRAHVAGGRPASALAAYAAARRLLADELGVDPSAPTEALHTAILRDELVLPIPASPGLIGRVDEVRRLDEALASAATGRAVGLTVVGPGGIGKTTLVRHVTDRWARASTAVVLWGRGDELGRDLPLQPVLDGLAEHLRSLPSAAAGAVLADAAAVLRPLLGAVVPADLAAAVPDLDRARSQLFSALLDAVERAAGPAMPVVVVDDAHLTAPGTVAWLRFALRRARRLVVIETRRPGAHGSPPGLDGDVLHLGPIDQRSARLLVGDQRAAGLHARSQGNPLLLLELARAGDADLPVSVRETVTARLVPLAPAAAATLRAAAALGLAVDVDLLSACTRRPVPLVLDDLEAGVAAEVLVEQDEGFAFTHDLVREVLADDMSAARRAYLHREAAAVLRARQTDRPLETAFHARLGGESATAAEALCRATVAALHRYELELAAELADEAVAVHDEQPTRAARARVHLAAARFDAAAADLAGLDPATAPADVLELAGWVAYYRRDHEAARAFAEAALERAAAPSVRASALALAGRLWHSRGDLAAADARLGAARATAPDDAADVARVWSAALAVHRGRLADAVELLCAVDLDAASAHPFAPLHGWFARAVAAGHLGRHDRAAAGLEALGVSIERLGGQGRRFAPVAANVRGWLARSVGQVGLADEAHQEALAGSNATGFEEPGAHAQLDLAELRLLAGDLDAASTLLDQVEASDHDASTMAWHVRQRLAWLRGRTAVASGDLGGAAERATWLAGDADERGSPRYGLLGRHLLAMVERRPDEAASVVDDLPGLAGLDAWWLTAELASWCSVDAWHDVAQRRAASMLATLDPRVDRDAVATWMDRRLDAIRSSRPPR